MKVSALNYTETKDLDIKCGLCPHNCLIAENQTGFCLVRKNISGELIAQSYANVSSVAVDPIEKKPLYHFFPTSKILSLGSWGCNLKCPFCQNFEISQYCRNEGKYIYPEMLEELILKTGVRSVAFTYSEPIVWYEYVLDCCRELKKAKERFYTVMVTNGYISKEPAKLLLNYLDALNIDLKVFNSQKYRNILQGGLKEVLDFIELSVKMNVHTEITTLIVPGLNDDISELSEEFRWLSSLSKDIPLHISQYFPRYKYEAEPKSYNFLVKVYQTAKEYLDYVYIGNTPFWEYSDTYCPDCKTLIVKRKGYDIKVYNVDEDGGCKKCGRKILVV